MIKNFEKRMLVGITGFQEKDWKSKLAQINRLKIKEAALFLERFDQTQRKKIYRALLDSSLERIPLVHARNDMEVEEFVFLESRFKTKCFNFHEKGFGFLHKWKGFDKKIFLEMDYNDFISKKVKIEKIGGFCVDLSHFKVAQEKQSKEFDFVYLKKNKSKFLCNHLNGYSKRENRDTHSVKSVKEFDYLRTLPKFIFGEFIGLEMENSIFQQLIYKKYLVKFLGDIFSK